MIKDSDHFLGSQTTCLLVPSQVMLLRRRRPSSPVEVALHRLGPKMAGTGACKIAALNSNQPCKAYSVDGKTSTSLLCKSTKWRANAQLDAIPGASMLFLACQQWPPVS
jgi:hypothetical protein